MADTGMVTWVFKKETSTSTVTTSLGILPNGLAPARSEMPGDRKSKKSKPVSVPRWSTPFGTSNTFLVIARLAIVD